MQQYLIIAQDGKDEAALERRMAARPAHFEGARELRSANHFVIGGAILNDQGQMIGSMMVVQFESEEGLKAWMDHEPYLTGNVWKEVEVRPFLVAKL